MDSRRAVDGREERPSKKVLVQLAVGNQSSNKFKFIYSFRQIGRQLVGL